MRTRRAYRTRRADIMGLPMDRASRSTSARPWLANYPPTVPHSLEPYPEGSLYSFLEDAARHHPDAPAISFWLPGSPMGKRLSYRHLLGQVERFSGVLTSLGVQRGDRVKGPVKSITDFGVFVGLAQGIDGLVHLSDLSWNEPGEQRYKQFVADTRSGKVTDFVPFPINILAPRQLKKHAQAEGEPWPPVPRDARVRWWKALMSRSYPASPRAEVDPRNDLAGLIYTGGTTGLSKGAMLTHFNLMTNVLQGASWFPDLRDGGEAVMCIIPFFHSFGMTVAMNLGIQIAGKLVLMPRFELGPTLKVIQKEKPTLFPGVPRLYIAINEGKETAKYDLSSIRACFSGAAPLPLQVSQPSRTGNSISFSVPRTASEKVIRRSYRRSEPAAGRPRLPPCDAAPPKKASKPIEGRRKQGSIGLPIPDTDAKIVDLDDWTKDVPAGHEGELAVSGPQIMRGYFGRPDETDAMIKRDEDGRRWLLTGDVARMDEDGYFFIVDRKKDMILVSGFNVYPTDIEQVIYRHPKVQKVCVVGIPDPTTGEAVKAYVVLKSGHTATAEEIREFTRSPESGLTGYKVPRPSPRRSARASRSGLTSCCTGSPSVLPSGRATGRSTWAGPPPAPAPSRPSRVL